MDCAGHVISHAPYVGICKYEASNKAHVYLAHRLLRSVILCHKSPYSIVSEVTCISGINSVGEDQSIMLKPYRVPLPTHLRWYGMPSGTC